MFQLPLVRPRRKWIVDVGRQRHYVTGGAQIDRRTWQDLVGANHEAAYESSSEELFWTERNLADAVYNMNGYDGLACHLSCYGQGESAKSTRVPEGVDSWLSAWEGSGSNRERREFQSVGMMNALRFSDWGLSEAQAPWDREFAENVMGLQSVLYTYRLARNNGEGRGGNFDDYWGSLPIEDPNCNQIQERRCRVMTLGNKLGGSGDPFEVMFHRTGQPVITDTVVVHGKHNLRALTDAHPDPVPPGWDTAIWGAQHGQDVLDDSESGIAVGFGHGRVVHHRGLFSENGGYFMHEYQEAS